MSAWAAASSIALRTKDLELGPLPQAALMPTGGVSLENVVEWIKAGCVAVGAGGSLTAGARKGDFQSITDLSRQFISKIREARNTAGR